MNFSATTNPQLNRYMLRLLAAAQRAGKAIGTAKQDDAYAQLILMDGLDDSERERLGFATHMITRAKQAGKTPVEMWCYIQDGFRKNQRELSNLDDINDIEMGVLAYGIGVCSSDDAVCNDIRSYLNVYINGRIAEHGLAFAWARS